MRETNILTSGNIENEKKINVEKKKEKKLVEYVILMMIQKKIH